MVRGLKKIYYQGRTVQNTVFDMNYVGHGIDQEGAGFYFTEKYNEALNYIGANGIVIAVELHPRKFVSNKAKPDPKQVKKLILGAPNHDIRLLDWEVNGGDGLKQATELICDNENMKDAFLEISAQFYDDQRLYLQNLIKMGYDGHFTTINKGQVVIYNPKVIKIIGINTRIA